MSNKTLVFLHPHFIKPGGASRVVLEQTLGLVKKGFDCLILTTKADPEITKRYPLIKIRQLSEYTTGNLIFWLLFPIFYRKLSNELKKIQNGVLYCHSLAIYWGFVYKLFNRETKIIYYIHDLGLPYTDSEAEIAGLPLLPRLGLRLLKPLLSLINQKVIFSANYIIANSNSSADYLLAKYHRKADAVVKPGVDISMFKPMGTKKDQVLSVGRLDKIKNINLIIKAFSIYAKSNPNTKTKLLIIGNGSEKYNLQCLCKNLGIETRVIFTGEMKIQELLTYYSESKLSLALCPNESFGLSAAESICCGTPVIGINRNGISEIILNHITGELVNNDPNQIASVLDEYLTNNNELITLTGNITDGIRKTFDWSYQINKLSKFLLPKLGQDSWI